MTTKFNNKYWVSELHDKALNALEAFYTNKLKSEGIYTKEEIKEHVSDLINEKLGNIEDSIGVEYLIQLSFVE